MISICLLLDSRRTQNDQCRSLVGKEDLGYQIVYNLEMIFALAFQINTYPAQQLREYIISRLFQSEKSMVICMVNGNHKSYLKC